MQKHKKNQLYVLEKRWRYKPGLKLNDSTMDEVLIRPCSVPYRTYRAFLLGHNVRCKTIVHEGCVLSWFPNCKYFNYYDGTPSFRSIEEFMVYANVKLLIDPLIEIWYVDDAHYKSYYMKTIDLKTNEVLYDKANEVLAKIEIENNKIVYGCAKIF